MARTTSGFGTRLAPVLVAAATLALAACSSHVAPQVDPARTAPAPSQFHAGAPVLLAAGDIASCREDDRAAAMRGEAVGALARAQVQAAQAAGSPVAILALGDLANENGDAAEYACFARAWEGLHRYTLPVPGEAEYATSGTAQPYFAYWQERLVDLAAAPPGAPLANYARMDEGRYFYSFDLGAWHIIALDSETPYMDAQRAWLAADLQATPQRCILAYWHRPRFSSGAFGSQPAVDALYSQLVDAGATVILNSHDRHYERFAPQAPDGAPAASGPTQFIVGTGGKGNEGFDAARASVKLMLDRYPIAANSAVRLFDTYGLLRLQLLDFGYVWELIDLNRHVRDSGAAACVERPATF